MAKREFVELLHGRWDSGKFVCVGLDPVADKLPLHMRDVPGKAPMISTGVRFTDFCQRIVTSVADLAGAFKPNSAFFECLGDEGAQALKQVIADSHNTAPEVPVILDVKRGDIGNTSVAYARAAFDYFGADAVTVNPFMGEDSLRPFLERADKGIFVLCRTSNPGAGEFQDKLILLSRSEIEAVFGSSDYAFIGKWHIAPGQYAVPLYLVVAARVANNWNKNGNCGLVVGATRPEELALVRKVVGDDLPILIPGVGSQGGSVERSVKAGMDGKRRGILVNASSSITFAGDGEDFAERAYVKARELHDGINQHRLA